MGEHQTIGIIGGGQLARMMTQAAKPLGFEVIVIDVIPNCPASQVGAQEIVSPGYERSAIEELARRADYLTVEFDEGVDTKVLASISSLGKPVNPAPQTISLIQDKFRQKEFLAAHGIPVGPFAQIENEAEATALLNKHGKLMIKTRSGGYDGHGNMLVETHQDIARAFNQFAGKPLYAEAFVPFNKELAIMVARDLKGAVVPYQVVQTVHKRNICDEVLVPAPVEKQIRDRAEALAIKVAQHLEGAGVFGIEMFLTVKGDILINEIAPRVHNSGHHTIEANRTSQFEQHVRAITGLPLGETDLIVPAAAMVNVLGERDGPAKVEGLGKALSTPHTSVHLYGKSPTKVDRKMGHITATGKTVKEARVRARKARQQLSI